MVSDRRAYRDTLEGMNIGVVDLHKIKADLPCDTCKLSMADLLISPDFGRTLNAYHLQCMPEVKNDRESN